MSSGHSSTQLSLFGDEVLEAVPRSKKRRRRRASTSTMSSGCRASKHGRFAEDVIANMLDLHKYRIERQKYLGEGIYGTSIYVDIVVHGIPSFPAGLIIESKWQDTSGTTDEKLPFLVENIRKCYPCPTIIVLHGGGFRPGAERWLREQVDGKHLIAVFRLEEFMSWIHRIL